MSEEITIKPRTESTSQSETPVATPATEKPTPSQELSHLVTLCASGLLVSFFLPWVNFLGAHPSGFDIQKLGDEYKLHWLIPLFSVVAIVAGLTKQSQRTAAQLAGAVPFLAFIYWFSKLGSDLMNSLSYGAYLALICGAGLEILSRRLK